MAYPDLHLLVACRSFLKEDIFRTLFDVQDDPRDQEAQSRFAAVLLQQAEEKGLQGNVFSAYLVYLLGEGDTIAARTIESKGTYGAGLKQVLTQDMKILLPYIKSKASDFMEGTFLDAYTPARPLMDESSASLARRLTACEDAVAAAAVLLEQYSRYGRGTLARHIAFRIAHDGKFIGIDDFPVLFWEDLIGYETQKEKLRINTRNFVQGKQANNVLLTGARGTGKSTAVKALANIYHTEGLRLIQITRDQLVQLSAVMQKLGNIKSKKFILFFDDLSFDEGESGYKYLKSAIDGSVMTQPENVLIYATSNRRHLLKETWQDRKEELEEVYRHDSANESISLSDRFGLILHYEPPTQEEYLEIIDHELKKSGVTLAKSELRIQGIRWEMEHSGRNGRIAAQFVKWYLGNV